MWKGPLEIVELLWSVIKEREDSSVVTPVNPSLLTVISVLLRLSYRSKATAVKLYSVGGSNALPTKPLYCVCFRTDVLHEQSSAFARALADLTNGAGCQQVKLDE